MIEPYNSTSIALELRGLNELGLSFVCSTCGHSSSVMLEQKEDGIALSNLRAHDSRPLRLWRYNPVVALISEGRFLILCGYCRSGKSALVVSPAHAGISSSQKKGNYIEQDICFRCEGSGRCGSKQCAVCEGTGRCVDTYAKNSDLPRLP